MFTLRLHPKIERRLEALVKKSGQTKSFHAREAVLRHIEDLEDYYLAERRLTRSAVSISLDEVEQEFAKRGY
jgi:RHH-type transcriptional regulator, rel operon repressor / antitoxin RelB